MLNGSGAVGRPVRRGPWVLLRGPRRRRRTWRILVAPSLTTPRLLLRGWQIDDAAAALGIYGHPDVARWLRPVMERVSEPAGMRLLLQQWIAQDARSVPPAGRRHRAGVLGDPLLQQQPHPGRLRHPLHDRAEPAGNVGMPVDAQRRRSVVDLPSTQQQPRRAQRRGHQNPPRSLSTPRAPQKHPGTAADRARTVAAVTNHPMAPPGISRGRARWESIPG